MLLRGRDYPPIRGGSEDADPPTSDPPASPPGPDTTALTQQRDEYRSLAEQRASDLAARDAELAELRQQTEAHQAAAATAQAQALEAHRARLLAEHAGHVVPDLVQGSTLEELAASVERAKAAHAAVVSQVQATVAAAISPGNPARNTAPDAATMTPQQKIAYAIAHRGN